MSSEAFKQLMRESTPEGSALQATIAKSIEETKELKHKEMEIYKNKVDTQYQSIQERKQSQEAAENIQIDIVAPNYYENLKRDNTEYFELAKFSPVFILDTFMDYVPYFARNLILIGAESGNGKSTIGANLAYQTLMQGKKVLMITNEEMDTDCYNRVTCLIKKWGYTNHKRFTKEQIETFNEYYPKLGVNMTVISDTQTSATGEVTTGHTTTLEGIKALLTKLKKVSTKYDAIIIDYFQNAGVSLENPNAEEWKVLDKLAIFLDGFRKQYNAPIVLLAQLKPAGENPAPYKERIERCKSIYNKCTCAIEVKSDPANSTTNFTIHKSRFSGGIGKKVLVGFDRGEFVAFDQKFQERKHNLDKLALSAQNDKKFMEQITNSPK